MRTLQEPTKWPIPDTVGNPVFLSSQHPLSMHPLGPPVLPLQALPPGPILRNIPAFPQPLVPPPVPYTTMENLNPNVPEFIPIVPISNGSGDDEPLDECQEAFDDEEDEVINELRQEDAAKHEENKKESETDNETESKIIDTNQDSNSQENGISKSGWY